MVRVALPAAALLISQPAVAKRAITDSAGMARGVLDNLARLVGP